MRPLVLDTNVVLDLLVFGDPRAAGLGAALEASEARWLATAAMRDELAHVMAYPNLAARAAAAAVLEAFDRRAVVVEAAAAAPVLCRDADDQKFIDLAVAHRATLLSKDREVLRLKGRLAALGVAATAQLG